MAALFVTPLNMATPYFRNLYYLLVITEIVFFISCSGTQTIRQTDIKTTHSFILPPTTVLPVPLTQTKFEDAPLLSAALILGRQNLSTSYYSIDPSVQNDGFMNHFQVFSPYGTYKVTGREVLNVKLDEIRALKQIDTLSTSKLFYDTFTDQSLALLTAPVRVLLYTGRVIANPGSLFDTATEVPNGMGRLAETVSNKVVEGSKTMDEAVKGAEEEVGGDTTFDTSVRMVTRTGERFLGFRRRYQLWLDKLRVDPHTNNKTLLDKISNLAWIETSIDFSFNFVPGLPGVASLSTFNRYHHRAQQLAGFDDEGLLESAVWRRLTALGIVGEARERFFRHPAFTATNRLRVLESLALLPKLDNKSKLVELANQANDQAHAFYHATVAEQLTDISNHLAPVVHLAENSSLPLATLEDGSYVIVLANDYLVWTQSAALLIADTRSLLPADSNVILWTTGTLSPLANQEISRLDISVACHPNGMDGLPSPEVVDSLVVDSSDSENWAKIHPRINEVVPKLGE
jgi:hypothetical protein